MTEEQVEKLMHDLMDFDKNSTTYVNPEWTGAHAKGKWIVSRQEKKAMAIVISALADCKQ